MAGSSVQYGYGALNQNPEMAAYPPIFSSASANYARLCLLVIDVGTSVTQQKVLQNLPESQTLTQALEENYGQMEELLGMKVISETQFDLLFPPSGIPVKTHKIDLSLWVTLLRNITADAKKINKKWQEEPQYWHQQYWHDIQRLKRIRNQLAHPGNKAELDEETFQQMWQETEYALLRLGVQEGSIKAYQEGNIDPERARVAVQEVTNQYVSDFSALLKRAKISSRRQNVFCSIVGIVIIILIIVAVVIVRFMLKPVLHSCANNIKYIDTEDGMVGYLSRKSWGARKPNRMDHLELPVKYVIISHTPSPGLETPCYTTDNCCTAVRIVQEIEMDLLGWSDISYNYVIDGSGIVFIGRSPKYIGATALGWNNRSVSFGITGMYILGPPPIVTLGVLKAYLQYLVKAGVVTPDFTVYGLCQVRGLFPDSPGGAFLKGLKTVFPTHWKPDNITNCNMNNTDPKSGDQ